MNNESSNAALHARRLAATPRGTPALADFFVSRARNAELWDVHGRRFIDFAGGVGVLNTGHVHPEVTRAAQRQIETFSHTCYSIVPYEGYVRLAERLNALAPIRGAKKTAFFTTGAEAVENAVKVARAHTGRSGVIAFTGGFHGRTMLGMALTGKIAPYKIGFGPFPPEIFHVPFPSHGVSVEQALAALDQLFKCSIEPSRVAAIIVEPVQGEGGFNVAPDALMRQLRQTCDQHGIVLIADEVQAGFGRTGRWFSVEHSGVEPDLITVAKSLAGGYPLSGLIGKAAIMDKAEPGGLGGTYAGNPVSIAAALAVIDVIERDGLLARADALGARLVSRLEALQREIPAIAEVRGRGSMIAAEFCTPGAGPTAFEAAYAKRVQQLAMARGLILLLCGPGGSAIRFLYPLTIEDSTFYEALDILDTCIREAA
ncbi:4-aminobutyrate--2-oxoglutarate transaminase [Cupriavidus numazuensis]|uniref:4-aminobutyrate aminotransferase PuuE n=1 Tax=Cupriavidus numazuensis TaxID=221992 RepID=A0ABM8TFS1_9BURK|nr:4-aminobutyrate--2-oxoglutarate transaminase [Cupriavidus numazuensis]CAG2143338.1 4-aminobutyrate aminotransferase PuuE [Cupriavidus numazuensis]